MIRVLHVIKGLDAGGAETLVLLAVANRDRSSFDVEVAHLLPTHVALKPAIEAEGAAVHDLHAVPSWDPRGLGRLRRLVVEGHFDVVHAHSPLVAAGVRVVARSLPRSRRPVVVTTLHNVWRSHHVAVRAIDRATCPLDDLRLAVSDAVRRSVPGRAGRDVVTDVQGVDVDAIRARADRAGVRAELGFGPDDLVVGVVANLKPHKAYEDLLAAAATVVASDDRVRFVAVGDGPLHDDLLAERDRLGLGDRFRFLGYRPDATRVLSGFDVFCLSSRHEGLPLALMEALVLGVPAVVTDVGGTGELVTDGVEGRLVPPSRPAVLADALVEVLADPDRRAAMGTAALRHGDGLRADAAAARAEAHYRRLLAHHGT
ncbi:MAG: glycosyltransferase [Actinobacteria bacterium]|nr:glycosyltransferase [Actinomycetota bacterium]